MTSSRFEFVQTGRDCAGARPDRIAGLTRIRHGIYAHKDDFASRAPWDRYLVRLDAFRLRYPSAVLSHDSAAAALGLPTFEEPQRIHVVVAEGSPIPRSGDVVAHRGHPRFDVVTTPYGPVTAPVDTAIDVARSHNRAFALAVWDAVARTGVPAWEFADRWQRQPSSRNRRALEWLTQRVSPMSESPGESISRGLFEWLGLPAPEIQPQLTIGDLAVRPDFYWRKLRTIGEFDGYAKYAMVPQTRFDALKREKRREDALRRSGFSVARWEHADLSDPSALLHKLSAAGLTPVTRPDQAMLAAYLRALAPSAPGPPKHARSRLVDE